MGPAPPGLPRPPAQPLQPKRLSRRSLRTVALETAAAQGSTAWKMAERVIASNTPSLRGLRERIGEQTAGPGKGVGGARAVRDAVFLWPRRPLEQRRGRKKTLFRSRLVSSLHPLWTPLGWDGSCGGRGTLGKMPGQRHQRLNPFGQGASELTGTARCGAGWVRTPDLAEGPESACLCWGRAPYNRWNGRATAGHMRARPGIPRAGTARAAGAALPGAGGCNFPSAVSARALILSCGRSSCLSHRLTSRTLLVKVR